MNFRKIILTLAAALMAAGAFAQVENAGGVRKRAERDKKTAETGPKISERMQGFFESKEPHDADLSYMRQIYRRLDLTKPQNTPLYFPEDVIDGQENLFRIMLKLVVDGKIPAYEYLDGREVFTDQYRMNVADMLERFGIYAQEAKGSTEKNPKFVIEEADVPTGQVLNYYIIEKWEFDRRSNRMKTRVEAICPVLNRSSDFGDDARYPMFWVKFDALRPYLSQQYVFLSDDNNLANYSIDDYFNLGMYDGEIYKTRNLRNLSMAQMFPDEDDRKRAQDSIDNRLRTYGKDLWVPDRETYLAMKEKQDAAAEAAAKALAAGDSIPERTTVTDMEVAEEKKIVSARAKKRTSTKSKTAKKSSAKKPKVSSKQSSSSSGAAKSVRRRKR
ncbi:MAG: gliding motility protein GldN [Muribaculaceae bacterium]|nr:gliding motility protein GldN [Muribaculaceae bacterium]